MVAKSSKKGYFGVILKDKNTDDLDFNGLTSEFLADSDKEACAVAQYILEKRKAELKLSNQVIIVYQVKKDTFTVVMKYSFA
jgi:hypothetical protein